MLDAASAAVGRVVMDDWEQNQKAGTHRYDDGSADVGAEAALGWKLETPEAFLAESPDDDVWRWGNPGGRALWASGEPCLIASPTGVGKTTLAGLLVRALIAPCDAPLEVLGYRVTPAKRVLYLAMDRPRQARRALRRQLDANGIDPTRLMFQRGPIAADIGRHPSALLELVRHVGADLVVIDSLKDLSSKLTDDEHGSNLNRAVQLLCAEDIDVLELHHQRKGQNGTTPTSIEDVYGSSMITNGCGSVILLWGKTGDPDVELRMLKSPADPVGPLKLIVETDTGEIRVVGADWDPDAFLRHSSGWVTAKDAAIAMSEKQNPSAGDVEKARRRLDSLLNDGRAESRKAGTSPTAPTEWRSSSPPELHE